MFYYIELSLSSRQCLAILDWHSHNLAQFQGIYSFIANRRLSLSSGLSDEPKNFDNKVIKLNLANKTIAYLDN